MRAVELRVGPAGSGEKRTAWAKWQGTHHQPAQRLLRLSNPGVRTHILHTGNHARHGRRPGLGAARPLRRACGGRQQPRLRLSHAVTVGGADVASARSTAGLAPRLAAVAALRAPTPCVPPPCAMQAVGPNLLRAQHLQQQCTAHVSAARHSGPPPRRNPACRLSCRWLAAAHAPAHAPCSDAFTIHGLWPNNNNGNNPAFCNRNNQFSTRASGQGTDARRHSATLLQLRGHALPARPLLACAAHCAAGRRPQATQHPSTPSHAEPGEGHPEPNELRVAEPEWCVHSRPSHASAARCVTPPPLPRHHQAPTRPSGRASGPSTAPARWPPSPRSSSTLAPRCSWPTSTTWM